MIRVFRDSEYDYDPADYEVVAEYDPAIGEWVRDERGLSDVYPSGTPPEVLLRQLNGPTYIAVDTSEPPGTLERSGHDVGPAAVGEQVDYETFIIDEEEEDEERQKSGRVVVDSVAEVPDDAIAHVTVDDEGDVEEVYYEP